MGSLTDLTNRQTRGVAYGILRGFREFGGAVAPFILGAFLIMGFDFYQVILIMAVITGVCFIIKCGFKKSAGTPEGTRTPNLLVRSQTLYPIELRALSY